MRVIDIINKIELLFSPDDIYYFSNKIDVCQEFINRFGNVSAKRNEIRKFLIDNEAAINAEKMLLIIMRNYYRNIAILEKELMECGGDDKSIEQSLSYTSKECYLDKHKKELEDIKKIAKKFKINEIISHYYLDQKSNLFDINIIDSEEYVYDKTIDSVSNLTRLEEIDKSFKEKDIDEDMRNRICNSSNGFNRFNECSKRS